MRIPMQTLEYRVYDLIARIAPWIMPGNRVAELFGDLFDQPQVPVKERIDAVRKIIGSEWKRVFYPGIRVNDDMPFSQRSAIFARLYLAICRINASWLVGYYIAAATGTLMLPDVYVVDLWIPLIFGGVAIVLILAYRDGFVSRPRRAEILSIAPDAYIEQLKKWISVMFSGVWSPDSGRSFMEALLFIFMSFGPVTAFIRWSQGYPLARDQEWGPVLIRVVAIGLMMGTWFYVKQANRLVAKILKNEFRRTESNEPAE